MDKNTNDTNQVEITVANNDNVTKVDDVPEAKIADEISYGINDSETKINQPEEYEMVGQRIPEFIKWEEKVIFWNVVRTMLASTILGAATSSLLSYGPLYFSQQTAMMLLILSGVIFSDSRYIGENMLGFVGFTLVMVIVIGVIVVIQVVKLELLPGGETSVIVFEYFMAALFLFSVNIFFPERFVALTNALFPIFVVSHVTEFSQLRSYGWVIVYMIVAWFFAVVLKGFIFWTPPIRQQASDPFKKYMHHCVYTLYCAQRGIHNIFDVRDHETAENWRARIQNELHNVHALLDSFTASLEEAKKLKPYVVIEFWNSEKNALHIAVMDDLEKLYLHVRATLFLFRDFQYYDMVGCHKLYHANLKLNKVETLQKMNKVQEESLKLGSHVLHVLYFLLKTMENKDSVPDVQKLTSEHDSNLGFDPNSVKNIEDATEIKNKAFEAISLCNQETRSKYLDKVYGNLVSHFWLKLPMTLKLKGITSLYLYKRDQFPKIYKKIPLLFEALLSPTARTLKPLSSGRLWYEMILASRPTLAIIIGMVWTSVPYLNLGLIKSPYISFLSYEIPMTAGIVFLSTSTGFWAKAKDRAYGVLIGVFLALLLYMYIPNIPVAKVVWTSVVAYPLIILAGKVQGHEYVTFASATSYSVTLADPVIFNYEYGIDNSSIQGRTNALEMCLARIFETMVGIAIAFLVGTFYFPQSHFKIYFGKIANMIELVKSDLDNTDSKSSLDKFDKYVLKYLDFALEGKVLANKNRSNISGEIFSHSTNNQILLGIKHLNLGVIYLHGSKMPDLEANLEFKDAYTSFNSSSHRLLSSLQKEAMNCHHSYFGKRRIEVTSEIKQAYQEFQSAVQKCDALFHKYYENIDEFHLKRFFERFINTKKGIDCIYSGLTWLNLDFTLK